MQAAIVLYLYSNKKRATDDAPQKTFNYHFVNVQVNHSPSFHTDTQLDREVKESLLTDTFTMLNIWQCDKKRVLEEDRKRIRDRLLQTNKSV